MGFAKEETKDELVVEEVKEENGEKKENAFSKLWKKTKQSVNDSILESKIESTFRNANREATVYSKNALLSDTVYGYMEDNSFVCFGKQELKPYSVFITENDQKAYYVVELQETTVAVIVDGESYERPATKIVLDENVEEVNVVKAGKRYFIYKGKEE